MTAWAELHTDPRHQLRYPNEHVVRFLSSIQKGSRLLDIGAGNGRHIAAAQRFGLDVAGVDCWSSANMVTRASMIDLPFGDDSFDAAVSFGVFYYGTFKEGCRAVGEMHRVLKPAGRAFVCVRTTADWRAESIPPDEPEQGMPMHFLAEEAVREVYGGFSELRYELSEWTTHERTRVNSDWLITVTK